MLPPSRVDEDCPDCLSRTGRLCERCARGVLPQLAVNVGWLKLMGNATVEQVKLQATPESADVKKAKRRNARRESRGYAGLARAILAA